MGWECARVVCALLASASFAAAPARAANGPNGHNGARHGVEGVRFWHYGVEDGLSQSTARVLVQDRQGFVWIGTQDGLNRFDGQEFRVYRGDPPDRHSLPDNYITALAPAPDGSVWVGTQAGGLARYRPMLDDFVRVESVEPEAARRVAALLMDAGGRLWLANGSAGLVWLDPATGKATPVPAAAGIAFGQVRNLRARRDGSVLVSARNGVWLVARDGLRASAWSGADGAALNAHDAVELASGHVWVASEGKGAIEFDDAGRELRRLTADSAGLPNDDVNAIIEDRARRLWFATFDGLARLDPGAAALVAWHYDAGRVDGIASSRIPSLMEDRDGLIWIGTWQNGFSLFNPRTEAFVELKPDPSDPAALPGAGVAAVLGDPDGTLWLGVLEGGGLVHFDLARGVLQRWTHDPDRAESLSHDLVGALARGKDGALWLGTSGGGLERLRPDGKGFEHFRHDANDPASIAGDSIEALVVDRDGNLWLGMDDVGLEMLCAGCRKFAHYPNRSGDPSSVGADTLNAVFEDNDGAIWVGLRAGGLARLDRATGKFEHFRADPARPAALSHDTISALYQDRGGRFWVGTQGGGLDQMLRDASGAVRFRAYTARDGLGSDAIGGVAEDKAGRIWVSTSLGISRVEPDSGRIVNYDSRDGAQARGYYIGATGRMADGRVVFGGLHGATLFDPDQVGVDLAPPGVAITSVRGVTSAEGGAGAGASWQIEDGGEAWLKLPHTIDDLAAEFSALHFSAPHRIRYSYRLSGLDEDWIETDSRRRIAMFTGLPPGEFLFQVRARSGDGPWTEPAAVRVRHMPSPWQTLWARAAIVLVAFASLAALGWELRSRLRERRHSERRLKQSEERLKLALWGSGNELWDMNLKTHEMRRSNPLQHVEVTAKDYVADVREMRQSANTEDLAAFDRAFADHVSGRSEHLDAIYRVRDRNGEWRWLRSRGRIVQRDPEGKPLRMVGTTEDITALKEHELALERINQDLERRVRDRTGDLTLANEQLTRTVEELRQAQRQLVDAEKMAALGGLVAGIAHEINTPLGISVTAASHLEVEARRVSRLMSGGELQRADLEAYQQVALDSTEMILRNLQRADKLVKSFKQVAVDQSSEQRRNIDLAEYLEEILTSLHPALKRTKHTVNVECPDRIVLDTYPGAIYQIVVNLAMNSLLHGFEGMEHGTISIRATREAESWVLDYRDDGKGMSEEVRRRVFEPFFTTRRGQGGSGLGLHIVFNLTHQVLLGTLRCESEPGKGARFVLRCPISPVP